MLFQVYRIGSLLRCGSGVAEAAIVNVATASDADGLTCPLSVTDFLTLRRRSGPCACTVWSVIIHVILKFEAKKQKGDMSDGRVDRAGSRGPVTANDADPTNQLISYTGNIPDFEDIAMPDLDGEDSQEVTLSPLLSESTLNTPQAIMKAPNYSSKP
ncbi:hypothetical protein EVAR_67732_1 [Eumeta japonica]|uniref:Uncharacterized protein n=1 Tax=Eumeta variegata TaxID=151549 RepID=A0A4C1ZG82_EUMVA|nr:hypothetical protein EVAR_67732_1 [Eumeta japonica]